MAVLIKNLDIPQKGEECTIKLFPNKKANVKIKKENSEFSQVLECKEISDDFLKKLELLDF